MNSLYGFSVEAVLADGDAASELNCHRDYDAKDENHLAADITDGDQEASVHDADQTAAEDGVRPPEMMLKKKTGRKAGKPVSRKVLEGYFSGSRKDAARSLGGKKILHTN